MQAFLERPLVYMICCRRYCRPILGRPHKGVLPQGLVQTFLNYDTGGERALGFDRPTPPGSSSGRYFSKNSVGHLGFTGTSFWMDLEQAVIVILLTNRIHPTRENDKDQELSSRIFMMLSWNPSFSPSGVNHIVDVGIQAEGDNNYQQSVITINFSATNYKQSMTA